METHLTDFRSAGFFVTREIDLPSYPSAKLLPARIISASSCLAAFAPDTWCIEWTEDTPDSRVEDAKAFGLQAEALAELTAWVTPRFDKSVRWPNILVDSTVATELVSLFLSSLSDIRVLELALHRSMVDEFCIAADPASQQPGFAPMGKAGVLELILKDSFPAKGGDILGFEPLVFNHSLSCSWLCNSLETVIEEALGIRPNRWGVIEGFEEARKCVEYISRDDVGAEPGLWLPWLLIDHTKRGEQGRLS